MKKVWLVLILMLLSGCVWPGGKEPRIVSNPSGEMVVNGIKEAFAEKYPEWDMEKVVIEVGNQKGKYAMGTAWLSEVEGGGWLAFMNNNRWEIIWDGNGVIDCLSVDQYDFPVEMVSECWDEEKGVMVDRAGDADKIGYQMEEEAIRQAIDEHDNEMMAVEVTFDEIADKVAKGEVTYPEGVGGWWLAVKENGQWQVLAVGSDVVDCAMIEPYDFPPEMVSSCYDWTNDRVVNRMSEGDLDELLLNLSAETGIDFSLPEDTEFVWYEYTGERKVDGRWIKVDKTANSSLDLVKDYFTGEGFYMDQYNVADGTIVGSTGYMKDTILCKVRQELFGGAAAMQMGQSDLIIEVSCGMWN